MGLASSKPGAAPSSQAPACDLTLGRVQASDYAAGMRAWDMIGEAPWKPRTEKAFSTFQAWRQT